MPKIKYESKMSVQVEHENGEIVTITDSADVVKEKFRQYVYCCLFKRYERITISLLDCANRIVKQFKQVM